ncbi:unnamed protein product [Chilo suppressalis]|uniref:Uncharacterized protein n=1 Tax=Chilo suppressalis TaxID=168631 RepID=A0ABN8B1D8_CHISP|nr:unnamed protein product [Chilo suppressalis]
MSPHKFLDCTISSFSKIGNFKEGENCGKFRFQPNSEYTTTGCFQVTLDEKLDVLLPGTQLKVVVEIPTTSLVPFSEDIICKNMRMIRCFSLKETIKEMYYYLNNSTEVIEKIRDRNFTWKNVYIRRFLGVMARQMSHMARNIAVRLLNSVRSNWHYICFIYCFCNADPGNSTFGPLSYILPEGTIIDMSADHGVFMYSSEHNSYLLYGTKVGKGLHKISKSELLKGMLEGYKIIHPAIEANKLVGLRFLESNSSQLNEGEVRNAYIGGVLYTFVKDSSITYGMSATVNRHLEETIRRIEKQGKKVILGKRWLDTEELDYDHLSPEKKKKRGRWKKKA